MKIIAIDIGNTSVDIGLFYGDELTRTARISTKDNKSEFEIADSIKSLLRIGEIEPKDIDIIISSVVPNKTQIVEKSSEIINNKKPIIVNHNLNLPVKNKYNPPEDVGIDRLVDSVAAVKLYGSPSVILDIGTCLVFNAVSSDNEYLGGSIIPGLNMAADSLASSTALLRPVELRIPKNIIGKNSIESIQSGIILGYTELIKGVYKKYSEKISAKKDSPLIITGGGAELILPILDLDYVYNENLSFMGLKYIYEQENNKK